MSKLPEDLIKNFLNDGTAKGLGDLSMMVSHIITAHSQGVEEGRGEEREKLIAVLEVIAERHNWGKDSLVMDALTKLKQHHKALTNQSEEKNDQ